eukprot:TRINITY_DN29010_c0_g1_i1.p1 TRINITY_DN29010_c0_g1~~TRINITY_DN29010_c0_g1_i1.p1  ORF type:complete len:277 (+),score=10.43 TRINITY_DN29010_c0_g1_i1:52-882(+)
MLRIYLKMASPASVIQRRVAFSLLWCACFLAVRKESEDDSEMANETAYSDESHASQSGLNASTHELEHEFVNQGSTQDSPETPWDEHDPDKCISQSVVGNWKKDPQCCSGAGLFDIKCLDGYKLVQTKDPCGLSVTGNITLDAPATNAHGHITAGMLRVECRGHDTYNHRRRWAYKGCGISWQPCATGNCCMLGSSCNHCHGGQFLINHDICAGRGDRVCVELDQVEPDPELPQWPSGHGCNVCAISQDRVSKCPFCKSRRCRKRGVWFASWWKCD